MLVEKLTHNWHYLCFLSGLCQDTLFLWRFDPAQFREKKKSILWVWIPALGKLHPGEYFSKQDTSCSLEELKTQHLGVHYCRNFLSWGSSFLKSQWKGCGKVWSLFHCALVKTPSAEARLLAGRLDLCCSSLVLWSYSITNHSWNLFGGQWKWTTWGSVVRNTLTSYYIWKGQD